ncbi:hypothetical protein SteCoe_23574 [Stentor coeruleus]|uniref:Uncharacterized protein n=1 Tax=Stentor coeruleus TaxID=5963 RepID=A0A1R2BJL0_9CILI|nr:hypothetical protein SteCoe_23574 [Stentor coeruleus]
MDNYRDIETLSDSVLSELSKLEMDFKKSTEPLPKTFVLTGSLGHEKINSAAKSFSNPDRLSNPNEYLNFIINLHEAERLSHN